MNGQRPSIVYKQYTQGEDLVVIPLTSAIKEKQTDQFDVFVSKDSSNNLFQNSFARLRQMRSVSTKRIGKLVGTITDPQVISTIDKAIKEMLGVEA